VILGVFHNAGYDQTVTLAQVFWIKDAQGQPARFFVAAERAVDRRGLCPLRLRHRRSCASGCGGRAAEVFDSFPPYGAWFRRRFGIDNEQALELFHQTVSMKSVGNLTDFVRSHMLEPFDVEPAHQALIGHFDDLNRAHEAVLKAKRQVALLSPLVEDGDRMPRWRPDRGAARCREALRPTSPASSSACSTSASPAAEDWRAPGRAGQAPRRAARRSARRRANSSRTSPTTAATASSAWRRDSQARRCARRASARRNATPSCRGAIGDPRRADEAGFLDQRQRFAALAEEDARTATPGCRTTLTEHGVSLRQGKLEHDALSGRDRQPQGPAQQHPGRQVQIRAALCGALGIDVEDMPFAGELLQVREDERDWEGAAERLLRGFGLALLVPDAHYKAVAEWVDGNHLRGRLVYFHVRPPRTGELPALHRDSLVRKLAIKPDSRTTTGSSASWPTASTSPAAPPRSSFAARRARSPAPARSRTPASATRRTTATASTTAAATCSAGATPPRSSRPRSQGRHARSAARRARQPDRQDPAGTERAQGRA
jgi:uncharacterized protein YPO0396